MIQRPKKKIHWFCYHRQLLFKYLNCSFFVVVVVVLHPLMRFDQADKQSHSTVLLDVNFNCFVRCSKFKIWSLKKLWIFKRIFEVLPHCGLALYQKYSCFHYIKSDALRDLRICLNTNENTPLLSFSVATLYRYHIFLVNNS